MPTPTVPPEMDLEESNVALINACTIILFILGSLGVGLRFWARRKSKQNLWWDDYLVLFSWLPFLVICASNFFGTSYGAGRHMLWVLQDNPNNMVLFLKYIYAVEIMYAFTIVPMKCSICCLYIRIFGIHRWFRLYNYGLMAATVAWGIATTLGSMFQCIPIQEAWNPLSTRTMCINLKYFLVGTNTPNSVLDLLILTAPIPLIWSLHLATKKKILVIAVLGLGASETAFSIARLVKMTSLGVTDMTWDYSTPIIWSTVEPSVGLLCACVPVMGALLPKNWIERIGTGRRSGNQYTPDQNTAGSSELDKMRRVKDFQRLGNSSNILDNGGSFDDTDADSQTGIRHTTSVSVITERRGMAGLPR